MNKRVFILNKIPINLIDTDELLNLFVSLMEKRSKQMVFNVNTFSSVLFIKNKKYEKVINSADIVIPDGWGPVWASKIGNSKLKSRINIGDYIDDLFKLMNKNSFSLYLLGSENETLNKTVRSIKSKYPRIKILGQQNGFFNKTQNFKIVKQIKNLKPNLVLVGMGQPKQEFWIYDNWNKLPNSIYIGVGGLFHYIAATKSRAPRWMCDHGLEWLYRLFQEPRRLFVRYTYENIVFLYYVLRSFIKIKLQKN